MFIEARIVSPLEGGEKGARGREPARPARVALADKLTVYGEGNGNGLRS